MILCACGCGEQLEETDSYGRKRRYINGHNYRGIHHSDIRTGKYCGKNSHAWKGGKKLSLARARSKRRKWFGFIPLNSCEIDGWVGHHLDYNYVIYIPEKLHKSVYHSMTKNINMDIINDKVYEWFEKYYELV